MPLSENELCCEGIVSLEMPVYDRLCTLYFLQPFHEHSAELISVQDCQWYTFTVFGIGVPAYSQTCSNKYTSRACSYRAYSGVASVVTQVQVRLNFCKHRETTGFYKHALLVECAGTSESRQTAHIPTWFQGGNCCHCRRVSNQLSSKISDKIGIWCKKFAEQVLFCNGVIHLDIYIVYTYKYIYMCK